MSGSSFQKMVAADLHNVFLNTGEFAEIRTVEYDDRRYEDIPVLLIGLEERDRSQRMTDHVQGLYCVSAVLYCALDDLGGNQPEQGTRIRINDRAGGGGFFREFYVGASACEAGLLQIELEAIDE